MNKFKLMLFGMFSVLSIATLLCISKVDSFAAVDYNDMSEVEVAVQSVKTEQGEPEVYPDWNNNEYNKFIDENGLEYIVYLGNNNLFQVRLPNIKEIIIPSRIIDENGVCYTIADRENMSVYSCIYSGRCVDTTDIKFPPSYKKSDNQDIIEICGCKNLKSVNIPMSKKPGYLAAVIEESDNTLENVYFEDASIVDNGLAVITLGQEVLNPNLNIFVRNNENNTFENRGRATEIFKTNQENVINVDKSLLIDDIAYINGMEIVLFNGGDRHAVLQRSSYFENLVIPENIVVDGVFYPVTEIRPYAIRKTVRNITIPASIKDVEQEEVHLVDFGILANNIDQCALEDVVINNPEITIDTIQKWFRFNWDDEGITIRVREINGQLNEVFFPVEEEAQEPEFDMELFLQENFPINLPEPQILQEDLLDENGEVKDCCICYGSMSADNEENGNEVITLPCRHVFHAPCIQKWAEKHRNCPYCQQPMQ